jgi:hypothetical protein
LANITIQMDRSIVGYGNVGDVITTLQTAQTDAMIANGEAHTYSGPVTPATVLTPLSRQLVTAAVPTALTYTAGIDQVVILTAAGAIPTLPTAVGNTSMYRIKNRAGASITPAVTSAQTIDGSAPAALAANAGIAVISDGANWVAV